MVVHYAHVLLKTASILESYSEEMVLAWMRFCVGSLSLMLCLVLFWMGKQPRLRKALVLKEEEEWPQPSDMTLPLVNLSMGAFSIAINLVVRVLILVEMRRDVISSHYARTLAGYGLFLLLAALSVGTTTALSLLLEWEPPPTSPSSSTLFGSDTGARIKRGALCSLAGTLVPVAATAAHPGIKGRAEAAMTRAVGAMKKRLNRAFRLVVISRTNGKVGPEVYNLELA